jgi:hypothetical protein
MRIGGRKDLHTHRGLGLAEIDVVSSLDVFDNRRHLVVSSNLDIFPWLSVADPLADV